MRRSVFRAALPALAFALLIFSQHSRSEEKIYHLETSFNMFGESYHMLLALGFDPNAYVHLPEYSGVSDPLSHAQQLKKEIAGLEEEIKLRQSEREKRIGELSDKGARNLGKQMDSPFPLWKLATHYQELGLSQSEIEGAYALDKAILRLEHQRVELEARLDSANRSYRFAQLLLQAGFKHRIVQQKLSDRPTRGIEVDSLKGTLLPEEGGASNKRFKNPQFTRLSAQLDEFGKASATDRETGLKKLKESILGSNQNVPADLDAYLKEKFDSVLPQGKKAILLWNRQTAFESRRNLDEELLLKMILEARRSGAIPYVVGNEIPAGWKRAKRMIQQGLAISLTEHWQATPFSNPATTFQKQIWFFDELSKRGLVSAQMGMMSGVMDGPAILSGLPSVVVAKGEVFHATPRVLLLEEKLPAYSVVPLGASRSFYRDNRNEAHAFCRELFDTLTATTGKALDAAH